MTSLVLTAALTFASPSGVIVGNGGDSIFCLKKAGSAKFPVSGLYVLDYATDFPANLEGVVQNRSVKESLDRIEGLLKAKAPQALSSFLSFRLALDGIPSKLETGRLWLPAGGKPLKNLKDEYARILPPNCRFQKMNRSLYGLYQQTVVRTHRGRKIVYHYDEEIIADYLARPDQIQASILFVHEWLWDFYEGDRMGAPKIRKANHFLHSEAADRASPEEFQSRVFHAQ
jgi:hypothetical protein